MPGAVSRTHPHFGVLCLLLEPWIPSLLFGVPPRPALGLGLGIVIDPGLGLGLGLDRY